MNNTQNLIAETDSVSNKKKSLIYTGILFAAFFLLLFFLHMTSAKMQEIEGGGGGGGGEVAVNFGNSDTGAGDNYESKDLDLPASKPVKEQTTAQEDIVTDDTQNDVPAVVTVKKPKDEPKKPEAKPVETPKPKPSKATNDALSNLLNGNSKGGDGDDKSGGNKGSSNGTADSRGYSGSGGSGTGTGGGNGSGDGIGNGSGYGPGSGSGSGGGVGSGVGNGNGSWKLAGRKLSSSNKIAQDCNEYGTVVVEVTVNKQGNVIGCKYVKGTTNTDPCLIQPAYKTARTYKWLPKDDAPEKQVGTIVINFKQS
ncbi:energy transducer TonB [Flavobacterium pallidum]|uniref:energy transducer TonB n=1 Tax=Flavobacterium pallidum TaxID=2172098 RepID=UPI001FE9302A|nr:energy transducer TonB [Flavobacterium pallidum]